MDQQELRMLRLLEEIEKDETPSQRDLSRKLDISLGLVNSFVKRLAQKGYCKIATIPKNRVKYLLTPKGAAEKTRLTYEYIQSSIAFYKNARQKIQELFKDLHEKGIDKIMFHGVSELAEISFLTMQETTIKLVGVVDDRKRGSAFLKKEIIGIDQIASIYFDCILITEIREPLNAYENLIAAGIPEDRIVMI